MSVYDRMGTKESGRNIELEGIAWKHTTPFLCATSGSFFSPFKFGQLAYENMQSLQNLYEIELEGSRMFMITRFTN